MSDRRKRVLAASSCQPASPGVSLSIQVRDLRAALAKAEQLGGRKTADLFHVPNGATIAQIADPEGNLVGLVQQ